ncbi:YbhB/YbcL family Raf kinase inhibitor-like protein [Aliiruegeria lutimaris]|uniref:Phospholipid-binding protein, PBP family n=1 Tax=Aliiruegeria lutimaris TaxID=571298 RepID=A0A1G8SQ17_9RHOB|nr:YbhB/YbcL family Raf kinase inhibitor-like protein [Aliiruegeria lutimaris]SDJ31322.1 hypothetical protein SAMN04488026_101572 [Aliiruegeria lutimaris]
MKSLQKKLLSKVTTAALVVAAAGTAQAAGGMKLGSPAFSDHDMLPAKYAAKGGPRNCDGEGVSPPLEWSNTPEGTNSYAIIVHDSAGAHGLWVTHWLDCEIPGTSSSFREGEVSGAPAGGNYVDGTNRIGKPVWFGPCPDVGNRPQHYVFTLIATDLEPDALESGLDKAGLLAALEGHALGATSLVGRYAR